MTEELKDFKTSHYKQKSKNIKTHWIHLAAEFHQDTEDSDITPKRRTQLMLHKDRKSGTYNAAHTSNQHITQSTQIHAQNIKKRLQALIQAKVRFYRESKHRKTSKVKRQLQEIPGLYGYGERSTSDLRTSLSRENH